VGSVLAWSLYSEIFPPHLELVPQLTETYELELAYYESRSMSDEEIVRNGAYFARVGDRLTRHFLMCSGEPVRLPQHSSSRLRSFFESNQFKTGYATHGLFPYRGKFHPQMIRGLLNVMGLKPGDTVADPMMGSGTVLIEAKLMGIKSIGLDASPFCRFMTQAKADGLTVPLGPVRAALSNCRGVFEHFRARAGQPAQGSRMRSDTTTRSLFELADEQGQRRASPHGEGQLPEGCDHTHVHDFLLLAYLDSAGYSERSNRKSPFDQFHAILERYLFVAEKIQRVLSGSEADLAEATALQGDARSMPIEDGTIDGILFSPPYSFAVDYLSNDSFHLGFMGVDTDQLREQMVGLHGRTKRRKYENYKDDMDNVLAECSRVLRPGRICTILVGTNNNQLGKILGVSPDAVQGLDELMVQLGHAHGLELVGRMARQITGMANTMRSEFIVMMQRT